MKRGTTEAALRICVFVRSIIVSYASRRRVSSEMNEVWKVICQVTRTYAGFPIGRQCLLVPVAGAEEAPIRIFAHLRATGVIDRTLVDIWRFR